jgi:hypothetical protein
MGCPPDALMVDPPSSAAHQPLVAEPGSTSSVKAPYPQHPDTIPSYEEAGEMTGGSATQPRTGSTEPRTLKPSRGVAASLEKLARLAGVISRGAAGASSAWCVAVAQECPAAADGL